MIEEFRKYIAVNELFPPEARVLLAVSGGIDSMVMAHLFLRCGYESGIAHCNFNLRGDESDADEKFVRDFAMNHSIPFFTTRFSTEIYAAEKGLSTQMAARELRYSWFEKIRHDNGFNTIALAHNLNDNIETFIINLVRGSGIGGFAGIKPKTGYLIRPLLFATRNEIAEYCDKYEVNYREDSSNSDTKYVRNKIRHLIIPVLKEINPSFERTIEETIERVSEINEIYSGHIEKVRMTLLKENRAGLVLNISEILTLSPLSTMIFELFRQFGLSRPMISELIKLTGSRNGSQLVTTSHRFIKNRNELIIIRNLSEPDISIRLDTLDELLKVQIPGKFSVNDCGKDFIITTSPCTTLLSLNKIKFPVVIRSWKPGDLFYPLGMNRKKKLSDFFIDSKFSIPEKEEALVLETEGKIACILGIRTDNRFRITGSTTKCLVFDGRLV